MKDTNNKQKGWKLENLDQFLSANGLDAQKTATVHTFVVEMLKHDTYERAEAQVHYDKGFSEALRLVSEKVEELKYKPHFTDNLDTLLHSLQEEGK